MPKNSRKTSKHKPTTAQRLADDPLYSALNEIGRLNEPLDAVNIRRREPITKCPAVLTCVGHDASLEERAACAAELIANAVPQISNQIERSVAKAVFALDDFAGTSVAERCKHCANSPHHVTNSAYWKHRPNAIESVLHQLQQTSIEPIGEPTNWGNAGCNELNVPVPPEIQLLTRLARTTATLHFSALATLFVIDLETTQGRIFEPHRSYEVLTTGEELLYDTMAFLAAPRNMYLTFHKVSYQSSLDPPDIVLEKLLRVPLIRKCLPEDVREQLLKLYRSLMNVAAPFILRNKSNTLYGVSRITQPDRLSIASGFSELLPVWRSWFLGSLTLKLKPVPYELVAAKSGRLFDLIRQHAELRVPIESDARAQAIRRLAVIFQIDEWTPRLSGESLQSRASRYFERTSTNLAEDSIVWYSKVY